MRLRTKIMRALQPREHPSQQTVVSRLRLAGAIVFETDVMDGLKFFGNDDYRRFQFIRHHKKMGYTKGQPDLVFIRNGRVYFVEMKTATGKQSPEQKEVQRLIEEQGQAYLVWRGIADCEAFLKGEKENGR